MEYYSSINIRKLCHLQGHEWTVKASCYVNKSNTERQILYDPTYTWDLKKLNSYSQSRFVISKAG